MKIGDTVDRYTLLKELGHGGMGGVWIGFDPDAEDLVAVKTIFEELANDELVVRRFQREIDVLRKLTHPNIVGFRGSGRTDRTYYMALEHIRGSDLADVLATKQRMAVPDVLQIITGVTRAIQHAHEKGVVHRDIKPSNIMVTRDGRVPKILDFGVAYAEDEHLMTATGDVVGTFLYAAPEQNQGKQVDERSDLYALGLTFWELLTNERALRGGNHQEVTTFQLTGQIPGPSERNAGVPAELDGIVMKLLEVNPDDRYQTSEELLFDLDMFLNNPRTVGEDRRSIFEYPELVPIFKEASKALKADKFDHALEQAEQLAAQAPRAAEVYQLKGQIQRARGASFPAINDFKRAITFDRGNIGYQLELADLYEHMGMVGLAKELYEQVLEIEPNSTKARRALEGLDGGRQETPSSAGKGSGGVLAASNTELNQGFIAARDERRRSLSGHEDQPARTLDPDLLARRTPVEHLEVDTGADDPPSSEGSLPPETQMRVQKVLDEALPKPRSALAVGAQGAVLWPIEFFRSGATSGAGGALVAQLALIGLVLHFQSAGDYWVPPSWLGDGIIGWAANPANAEWAARWGLRGSIGLYGLACLWFGAEAYQGARYSNLRGYVVEVNRHEGNVVINAGREAGLDKGSRLRVYQERDKGAELGLAIGDVELIEVLPVRSVGQFHKGADRDVRVGDFVVVEEAVSEGWVDPTQRGAVPFPSV